MIYIELKGCKEGELNTTVREVWCNLRREFCKHVKICPLGYKKEATHEPNRKEVEG